VFVDKKRISKNILQKHSDTWIPSMQYFFFSRVCF